jgi:hypothetical protein
MPLSAVDVISPAFVRMKQHLFKPFRLSQWVRLAIVGFLAGELGTSGFGSRFPANLPFPQDPASSGPNLPFGGGLLLFAILFMAGLLALAVGVAFIYVGSRMQFVLFDSVLAGECRIREFWSRRGAVAFRYFVWQLLFVVCIVFGMILLLGIPLLLSYSMGWFSNPREHLLPLVLGGIVLLLVFLAVLVVIGTVKVLVKDFVVPQMVLDNVSVGEGWERLWSMMTQEKAGYAGYIAMKIVLSFAAAVILSSVMAVVFLVLLIPVGGAGAITVLAGKAAGLTWNPLTIAIAIVVGSIILIAFLIIATLISVPAVVFFPAYAIHFFAERYPALHGALYPPSTVLET